MSGGSTTFSVACDARANTVTDADGRLATRGRGRADGQQPQARRPCNFIGERAGTVTCPCGTALARSGVGEEAAGDAFGFASAAEQAVDAQVIIEGGPVDAGARAASFPIAELLGRGLEQGRIPGQRHADDASVHELRGERLVIDDDILNLCARRTHSTLSIASSAVAR